MNSEGLPIPPGVTWEGDGWNFALLSRHATGVTLLLYDGKNFVKPVAVLKLDPLLNKTGQEITFALWDPYWAFGEGKTVDQFLQFRAGGQDGVER